MDLDQQIQTLIQEAPSDGITLPLVAAIAPVLKAFAQQLQHSQYYILQTLEQDWVLTTLQNQTQPNLEKTVLYAFSTLKDVTAGPGFVRDDPQLMALPVPIIDILFQMTALNGVDSAVFFENPGDLINGAEIQRAELQGAIQYHLQLPPLSSSVPSDLA
ncbi:hypothetical protein DO97_12970 [Neosynechococcus sphagnicola sy1]|uniref:Uncharacterized protein n=1 Tax=Neosynechococcus sphagnicola sy1 TaxID=1497020 RepID=A0A098TN09_9CYAN|nr:hypothetical protein [Neosynechococcus sphagnicola]KGF73720.1 hypothetical protein DO97_12970 [Neosynechococcus sphagnicola sy1]